MPQPKSRSGSSRSSSAKTPAAKRTTAAKKPAAAEKTTAAASRSAAAKKGAATKRKEATKRSASAKKAAATRKGAGPKRTAAKTSARKAGASSRAAATQSAQTARQAPEDLVDRLQEAVAELNKAAVLTRERIEEVVDDAVSRGKVTRDDAEKLARDLFNEGRKQAEDFRADVEQLLGRTTTVAAKAPKSARKQAGSAARQVRQAPPVDRLVREADKARRAAGVGPSFPIIGYDDLTAGQVTARLSDLTPAELRKVRDYERRNANRKSVLNAIEKKLA